MFIQSKISKLVYATVLLTISIMLGCITPPGTAEPDDTFVLGGQAFRVETVTTGLEVPWSIGFSPDGTRMFVTERPGRLQVIEVDSGAILGTTMIQEIAPPLPRSERGLMGLAVSPTFDDDPVIYVSYTTDAFGDGAIVNVVDRWRLTGNTFERMDEQPIVDELPAAFIHDGMPLGFGPDGKLYISVGDATSSDFAQSLDRLNGKYLRLNPDGSIPEDNPFGTDSAVFSLGHRNSQGFDWHPTRDDVLLATEHGSSFPLDGAGGQDEINLVRAGMNYGWPDVRGAESADGIVSPLYQSGEDTIAPAGGTFVSSARYPEWVGRFLFVGLADRRLWVAELDDAEAPGIVSIESTLDGAFGRLRAVCEGPDGYIYMSTSNRDSRGTPIDTDDRILRLVPLDSIP